MGYVQWLQEEEAESARQSGPPSAVKLMSDYSIKYRTENVEMNEALTPRLNDNQLKKCAFEKIPIDFARPPVSPIESETCGGQLYCMANALPSHRSIWRWLVATLAL